MTNSNDGDLDDIDLTQIVISEFQPLPNLTEFVVVNTFTNPDGSVVVTGFVPT